MKLKIPQDLSLFCLNVKETDLSGLQKEAEATGRYAVELLALLLANNEIGIPREARCWQLPQNWQPGRSLKYSLEPYLTADGRLREAVPAIPTF